MITCDVLGDEMFRDGNRGCSVIQSTGYPASDGCCLNDELENLLILEGEKEVLGGVL